MPTPKRPQPRPKKPRKRVSSHRFLKIGIALSCIPIIFVTVFLIRYYYIFDAIIQQKLGKRNIQGETQIYAAPTLLAPGRRVALADLIVRLRRAGYEDQAARPTAPARYRLAPNHRLVIHNEGQVPQDGGITAEITFAGPGIRAITDVEHRKPLDKLALKPQLLSNTINKSREKRRYVSYAELPKVLVDAVLAAEDRRFFSHSGVDPIRILKALLVDMRQGDTVQGASTLTQQFVKNYFLTPERTWRRKFTDAYMSILLEQRLSKEQIFELYANEVYLGQRGSFSIVGFGEGAEAFFDKNVKDLNAGEAAMLAGIITAPNRYTPIRYPDRAKARRNLVLDQMAEYDMITAKEREQAKARPLEVKPSSILNYSDAPYFIDLVQDQLIERFGDVQLGRSRYKVYSTLDMDLQQAAYESLQQGLTELDAYFAKGKRAIAPGTVQASLIAVDPKTGHILAMIGGRNYGLSQFNRISQSKRQPGSIFKPFVYAAALETAYHSSTPLTAASTVVDEPTRFTFENLVYEPRNFKDEYFGQVTMRQAITKSLNVATIKFAESVGYPKIVELAHRLGLNEQIKPYPAMAIGAFEVTPLEMVRAYTAFANGGRLSELEPVYRIYGEKSNIVFSEQQTPQQALTPQVSYVLTSLLQSVINNGTAAGARSRGFTLPAAGKTGTSHDGWFAGYTPDLLCIVWVGFDDNRELNLSGAQSALPIWTEFMKRAQRMGFLSGADFALPQAVPEVEIDPTTGLLANVQCLERQKEIFIKGTEPALTCMGNNYEQMRGTTPASIYATPVKEPVNGADNNIGAPEGAQKP